MLLNCVDAFDHSIPPKAVQAKVCRPLQFVELKTHLRLLYPLDFRTIDRKGIFLIRQNQANEEVHLLRHGTAAFNRGAEHRQVCE